MGQMACKTKWEEGMRFQSTIRDHKLVMDAAEDFGGSNKGPTPKELLLSSITGCSGMDVISLLKKMRQPVTGFEMEAKTHTTEGHPSVLAEVHVVYSITAGAEAEEEKVIKSVTSSMTKYCGVSAMVAEICPIHYSVVLNGEEIYKDQAKFQIPGF
jgi:putative redox protein